MNQVISDEIEELGNEFIAILESQPKTAPDTSASEEASFWTNIDGFEGNAIPGAVKGRLFSPPSDIPYELAEEDPDFGLR